MTNTTQKLIIALLVITNIATIGAINVLHQRLERLEQIEQGRIEGIIEAADTIGIDTTPDNIRDINRNMYKDIRLQLENNDLICNG